MLTPVEIQGRELKTGRGYQKKEMDEFLAEIHSDYEKLYRENIELKDKLATLNEGLNYYKDLEKTLQKTLVVAEKTAEETTQVARNKADVILEDAQAKAAALLNDAQNKSTVIVQEANSYFEKTQGIIKSLMQQYEAYRIQCKKLADANLELLNSPAFQVDFDGMNTKLPEFRSTTYEETSKEVNTVSGETASIGENASNENKVSEESLKAAIEERPSRRSERRSSKRTWSSLEERKKEWESSNESILEATKNDSDDVSSNVEPFEDITVQVEVENTISEDKKEETTVQNTKTSSNKEDTALDNDIFEFFNLSDE